MGVSEKTKGVQGPSQQREQGGRYTTREEHIHAARSAERTAGVRKVRRSRRDQEEVKVAVVDD